MLLHKAHTSEKSDSWDIGHAFPSFCANVFLETGHSFFQNFGLMLENHFKLYVAELDFFLKMFLPPKQEKCTQNGPKTGF